MIGQEKTYETGGSKQVWVSQPSSGLDKRQATLQLCIRAYGSQRVEPAIVLRGKGNITEDEKLKYDKIVPEQATAIDICLLRVSKPGFDRTQASALTTVLN